MGRQEFGGWLEEQRLARGWSVKMMRTRLREAAEAAGDHLPGNDTLNVMIHRWEGDRSGMSERYRSLYCRVFGIPLSSFGEPASLPQPGSAGGIAGPGQAGPFQAALPVQAWPGGEELRAAIRRLCDPGHREELCFVLGYASAVMALTGCGRTGLPGLARLFPAGDMPDGTAGAPPAVFLSPQENSRPCERAGTGGKSGNDH